MENQFFVDSEYLSPEALAKKHLLETDSSSRKNHMDYLPGMEIIESDVCANVMAQVNSYNYSRYTAADVKSALEHDTCSIEDFKALLSPAAELFLEQMAQRTQLETSKHFGNTVYLFTPLYIANYCENYCVYCGFNCYNHIKRMKLSKKAKIIDDYSVMEIVSKEPAYIDDAFAYFSLLNISGTAKGVIIENAKYLLNNAEITCEYQYGISNEVLKRKTAKVAVEKGNLLLVKIK